MPSVRARKTCSRVREVVHHVGELEAGLAFLCGLLAVLLDDVVGDGPRLEQQSPDEGGLAVVDVADDRQVLVGFVTHDVSSAYPDVGIDTTSEIMTVPDVCYQHTLQAPTGTVRLLSSSRGVVTVRSTNSTLPLSGSSVVESQ